MIKFSLISVEIQTFLQVLKYFIGSCNTVCVEGKVVYVSYVEVVCGCNTEITELCKTQSSYEHVTWHLLNCTLLIFMHRS